MKHFHQRGVALLVAITIFAIATVLAAAITYDKAMAARRAAATFTLEQALQAGMAAEALADIALEADASNSKTSINQQWAQPLGPVEIEGTGIWIQAQLEDLSARFNLNSVVKWDPAQNTFVDDQHQIDIFRKILGDLNIDLRYADYLVDWIDPDIAPYGQGGEDTLYLSQSPPYRPPNTFIIHPSELLALPGFGAENYTKLAPYVTALPNDIPVNVCTSNGIVLDASLNDSSNSEQWIHEDLGPKGQRAKGCYPDKAVYLAPISDPAKRAILDAKLDDKSSWFRLRTNIRIGTAEFVLYSVLYREPGNKVRTVQRSFGSE